VGKKENQVHTAAQTKADATRIKLTPEHNLADVMESVKDRAEAELKTADKAMQFLARDRAEQERGDIQKYGLNESMTAQRGGLIAEGQWDYYLCVVFQSAAQRVAFLQALQWNRELDGGIFLDGQKLASYLRIPLPPGPAWKEGLPKDIWEVLAFKPGDFKD
jgi:hypothetical protein